MKWLVSIVALFVLPYVLALKDGSYFTGCPLQKVSGSGASGLVACIYGTTNYNNSLMCTVQYASLASDLVNVDITIVAGVNVGKIIDFTPFVNNLELRTGSFDGSALEVGAYQQGNPQANPVIPTINSDVRPANVFNISYANFATSVLSCFDGSAQCFITLRTTNLPTGEASCTLGALTFGASFEFPLNVNLTVAPTSTASGYAYLDWFVANNADARLDASQSVWAYAIDYNSLSAPPNAAGLFNAGAAFPQITSMPATIAMDVLVANQFPLRTGSFVGVAVQKAFGVGGLLNDGGYNVINTADNYNFLLNCSLSYCYVGVQTTPFTSPIMELRGQLIAGVGTLLPSLITLLCLLFAVVSH